MPSFKHSNIWLEHAKSIIPGGVSTNAKSYERLFPGVTPVCCAESNGAYFTDLDDNVWLDFEMSMGCSIWGHNHPIINQAVMTQLAKGSSFTLPSELEVKLAQKLLKRVGTFEMIRFSKNGADVVSASVRIARAFTRRSKVLSGTYHGWHDWSANSHYDEPPHKLGIPESAALEHRKIDTLTYSCIAPLLRKEADETAAVVVTPEDWSKEDLKQLRALCNEVGTLLIFDEVTSFMKEGICGVMGKVDVIPDMLCLSKGLANGLPLAALMGPTNIMKLATQVKFSHAHASEPLALAAAIASENMLKDIPNWPTWGDRAQQAIATIQNEINTQALSEHLIITGRNTGYRIQTPGYKLLDDPFRAHFVKQMAKHKIYSIGYIICSDAHCEDDYIQLEKACCETIQLWAKERN